MFSLNIIGNQVAYMRNLCNLCNSSLSLRVNLKKILKEERRGQEKKRAKQSIVQTNVGEARMRGGRA